MVIDYTGVVGKYYTCPFESLPLTICSVCCFTDYVIPPAPQQMHMYAPPPGMQMGMHPPHMVTHGTVIIVLCAVLCTSDNDIVQVSVRAGLAQRF